MIEPEAHLALRGVLAGIRHQIIHNHTHHFGVKPYVIVARLYVGIYNQVGISVQSRISVAKLAYHTRKVGPLYFKTAVLCFSLAEFEYGVD